MGGIQQSSPFGGIAGILLLLLGILALFGILIFIIGKVSQRNKGERPVTGPFAPETGSPGGIPGEYVKRCPTCQSVFMDETLAFCLSDGSTLERVANTFTRNDPNATLVYREAGRSDVPPTVPYHPDMSSNKKG